MQIFNSGFFWFVEGILFCVMVLGVRAWARDRALPQSWWKWLAFGLWVSFAGFTIAFVGTSFGEGEPTAAVRGGILFGGVVILSGVGLWRLWMIGATHR
jgi:hypothetical protein